MCRPEHTENVHRCLSTVQEMSWSCRNVRGRPVTCLFVDVLRDKSWISSLSCFYPDLLSPLCTPLILSFLLLALG